jgi:lipopolysaccharide transport protein LptA
MKTSRICSGYPMMKIILPVATLAIALAAHMPAIFAAETQSTEAVVYTSDGPTIVRPENDLRIVELYDNVRITQGSLTITGSRAILQFTAADNQLLRATIHGDPVNYRQQQEGSDEVVTGSSNTIVLTEDEMTENTIIELLGDAKIQTADSVINCAELTYDTVLNIIPTSTGPCGGSLSSPSN